MNRGTVFECTTPNGAVITAVVINSYPGATCVETNICYSQNKLFEYNEFRIWDVDNSDPENPSFKSTYHIETQLGDVLCDYCVIPELDEELKKF
jgi:hypothetical protein